MMCYAASQRIKENIDPARDLWILKTHPNIDTLHLWIWMAMQKDEVTGRTIPHNKYLFWYRRVCKFCWDHNIKIIAKIAMFPEGIHEHGTSEYTARLHKQVKYVVKWMYALPTIRDWGLWNEPQLCSVPYPNIIKPTGPHWSADQVRDSIVDMLKLTHSLKPIPVNLYTPAIEPIGISVFGDFEEPSIFLEPLLPRIKKYIKGVLINAYIPLTGAMPTTQNYVIPYKNLLVKFSDVKFFPSEQGIHDAWMRNDKVKALEQLRKMLSLSWDIGFPYISYFILHAEGAILDNFALIQSDGTYRQDKIKIIEESLEE